MYCRIRLSPIQILNIPFGLSIIGVWGSAGDCLYQPPLVYGYRTAFTFVSKINFWHWLCPLVTFFLDFGNSHNSSSGKLFNCQIAAMSSSRCNPNHKVFTPGSPSLFRPKKPPNRAIQRTQSTNNGGTRGGTGV